METLDHMLWFGGMALFVNLVTYGGVTLAYVLDKRRVDPPRPHHQSARNPQGSARSTANAERRAA